MALRTELEQQGNWLFRWRSYLPLLFLPVIAAALLQMRQWPLGSFHVHEAWEVVCLVVSFSGLAVRVLAVGYAPAGTSGRGTRGQMAESLNTTGIYSVVRHPLYLGNFLIVLGAVLVPLEWWLALLYVTAFWLYYERIVLAEEAYLYSLYGDEFAEWADQTPAFVPRLSHWIPAELPFSLRTVLKREYTALLVVIGLHAAIELVQHWVIEQRLRFGLPWELLLSGGVMSYLVLRSLKRHTCLLDAPGR